LGSRFRALPIEPWVATTRDYLWADYLHPNGAIGGGISAMPSMHVAIALWVALTLRAYFKRLQWLGWAWFAAILIGSIHLGWHYALDGIAASLIAAIAWRVAKQIVSSETPRSNSTFQAAPSQLEAE
jgi:membrane-associated phospholipid phosphatase